MLTQAQAASKKTDLARFEEDAGLAFAEVYAVQAQQPGFSGITEAQVIDKLKISYGYEIEQEITGTSITAITADPASVEVNQGSNVAVTITPNNVAANYVKIKGVYYQIIYSNSSIQLGEPKASIGGEGSESFAIASVESSNDSVATASKSGSTVTITGAGKGEATITVKYTNSVTTTIGVTVKGQVTVTFDANGGTFSDNQTTKTVTGIEGETVNLPVAPTKTDFRFMGWYTAASNGTKVYERNATTGELPTSTVTYYAQWGSNLPEYTEMGTATAGDYSTITNYWEYLYSDTNNIYLIHKDYLPNQYAYAPAGFNMYNNGYMIVANFSRRDVLVNYLITASNWENISEAIARDLNTITSTNNYSTSNVTTIGAPTLPQLQAAMHNALNDDTFKVGYVETGSTIVYSDESKTIQIGGVSEEATADGWVYCGNYSVSNGTNNAFSTLLFGYFKTAQGTALYTTDIDDVYDKAQGYWLARTFCWWR